VVNVINDPQTKPLSEVIGTEGTYLIVGGFLGLGGSIAKLLVKSGARHLVFLSRSGASSDASKAFMKHLQSSGVVVRAVTADVCDATALQADIKIIAGTMPPIQGVFQCAAVISDAVFDNMTFDGWSAAVRCKTIGSWNLIEVLKDTGVDPFYIFLASSAGVIGNRGQANYAAGNSFEDSMARTLRLQGNHAVSIDLGPVLGAGMLADDEQILDMLRASGFHSISHDDFLKVLSHAITGEIVDGQPMPPQVVLGVGTGAIIRQNQPADPYWTRTALYSYLNLIDMPTHELSGRGQTSSIGLRAMLTRASTVAVAGELISEGIRDVLAKAMTLLSEEIDAGKPPNAYGVDSLVAIGLRNWVQGQCGVEISLFEVLSELSVAEMGLMIARKGGYGGGSDA
jgi:NAD(P)-dependent dehydrogenase (short-subunit alcohol dehydrogenase family)